MNWESPISTSFLTESSSKLKEILVDSESVFLVEERAGISFLVDLETSQTCKTLAQINLETTVHEYGGAAIAIRNGTIVAWDNNSKKVYVKDHSQMQIHVLSLTYNLPDTYSLEDVRFADFNIHPSLQYAAAIIEVHCENGVYNHVCVINLVTGSVDLVCKGSDFYASPRFSKNGTQLLWVSWENPDMSWTKSRLCFGDWCNTSPGIIIEQFVDTGIEFAVSRPQWGPSGEIIFACDLSGFYNIYRYDAITKSTRNLFLVDAEFSCPDWVFGMYFIGNLRSSFDVLPSGLVVAAYSKGGMSFLVTIDQDTGIVGKITDFSAIEQLRVFTKNTIDYAVFIGKSSLRAPSVYTVNLLTGDVQILWKSSNLEIDPRYISVSKHIEVMGDSGLVETFGHFYPPKNDDYTIQKPSDTPLIMFCHGGPTAHSDAGFDLSIQFWTSRGFAVCDVNYGGSSNYGRAYRERLDGSWGIVDTNDICLMATHLSDSNLVNKNKMFIRGGSSGGYSALCCLTFRPEVFAAGCSRYGICDLVSLAKLTHKFEKHYMEKLLGGTYATNPTVYYSRSPINFADKICAPLLVFQGDLDCVVPPNQSQMIVDSIKIMGGRVEYHLFAGEKHGFKNPTNIQTSISHELEFYRSLI